MNISMVHVDDVASAHIFLLHYPIAKGRYNCSSNTITINEMSEFLSAKYPQLPIPTTEWVDPFSVLFQYYLLHFFGFISAADDLKRQNVQHFCRSLSGIQGYRTPGVSSRSFWIRVLYSSMGWMKCLMEQFNAAKKRAFFSLCWALALHF